MVFADLKYKAKQFIFKSKTGKVIGGAYLLYVGLLIGSSAQIGLQLGAELRSVPQDHRMEYISTFMSKNF